VVRAPAGIDLETLRGFEGASIVSAGAGVTEHPTQALLDLATIWNKAAGRSWETLAKQRWVLVGDLKRSRVAGSWARMAESLGMDLRWVSPADWKPDFVGKGQHWTDNLEEGLEGATGVICLRIQKERFQQGDAWDPGLLANYIKNYQIGPQHLRVGAGRWLMHPGPTNWGVELDAGLESYERSLIQEQVSHGLKLRSRLLFDLFATKS
jgi:aspartate carbamoyltransferase catalytic subunit